MNKQPSIAAVITAGRSPKEDDPLAEYTQGRPKAIIPIAGKPMVTHVVDALTGSRYVKHVIIVALDPALGVQFPVPVEYVPDAGNLVANACTGIQYALTHYPGVNAVLLCGSDLPTIAPATVDTFVEECLRTEHDVYYSVVERSVMEARFPDSHRSYIHLKDGDFAGGDMSLFRPSANFDHQALMNKLSTARKSVLRQASMLGPGFFLKLLTRRLSLAETQKRLGEIFELRGRAVPFSAEVGMDVDKPFQLEIVRAELEARGTGAAA